MHLSSFPPNGETLNQGLHAGSVGRLWPNRSQPRPSLRRPLRPRPRLPLRHQLAKMQRKQAMIPQHPFLKPWILTSQRPPLELPPDQVRICLSPAQFEWSTMSPIDSRCRLGFWPGWELPSEQPNLCGCFFLAAFRILTGSLASASGKGCNRNILRLPWVCFVILQVPFFFFCMSALHHKPYCYCNSSLASNELLRIHAPYASLVSVSLHPSLERAWTLLWPRIEMIIIPEHAYIIYG